MSRLVDVDELKLELKWLEIDTPVYHDVMSTIDEMPTVDPVKHGYWITWFENEDVRQAKCSECGMMFTLGKGRDIHYCGNCGAYMEEKDGTERK